MLSYLQLARDVFRDPGKNDTKFVQPPPDPLDKPLFQFSEFDAFTIRDACEGVQIFGGIGSGKTSGSGRTLAYQFLKAGFGGLVLTAKPEETQLWQDYAEATGRADDLIIVNPENEFRFNFLDYECTREGRGAGLTENLIDLFITLTEVGQRGGRKGGEDDAFWKLELRKMLRNAIDLLTLAKEPVTLSALYDLIISAPQSADTASDDNWLSTSFCANCLFEGKKGTGEVVMTEANPEDPGSEPEMFPRTFSDVEMSDYQLCWNYWLREIPYMSEKTRTTIISMFTGMADVFLRGLMKTLFCNDTTFNPEDSLDGKIIVLDLPQKSFNELGVYAQVMFKYCWQRAIERRAITTNSRPVFQWIDEAQFFVNEHDVIFQTTARSARSCNVYLTQNLPNYYYVMGGGDRVKHLVDSLLGNLTTKIFHNNTCATTNAWAAELFAREWQTTSGTNVSFAGGAFTGGQSSSQVLEYSVLPREFSGLLTGGPSNNRLVEAIIHQKGKLFGATGTNALRATFSQT